MVPRMNLKTSLLPKPTESFRSFGGSCKELSEQLSELCSILVVSASDAESTTRSLAILRDVRFGARPKRRKS